MEILYAKTGSQTNPQPKIIGVRRKFANVRSYSVQVKFEIKIHKNTDFYNIQNFVEFSVLFVELCSIGQRRRER
jgi:hypothetical protein